jgi:hypothetical protein
MECRDFYCGWLTWPTLGPEWRPNKCKMFLRMEGNLFAVHVDPRDPMAWRREPFFRQRKEFADKAVERKQQVVVYVKNRGFVIFPNKEVDVDTMSPGDELVVKNVWGPAGQRLDGVYRERTASLRSEGERGGRVTCLLTLASQERFFAKRFLSALRSCGRGLGAVSIRTGWVFLATPLTRTW